MGEARTLPGGGGLPPRRFHITRQRNPFPRGASGNLHRDPRRIDEGGGTSRRASTMRARLQMREAHFKNQHSQIINRQSACPPDLRALKPNALLEPVSREPEGMFERARCGCRIEGGAQCPFPSTASTWIRMKMFLSSLSGRPGKDEALLRVSLSRSGWGSEMSPPIATN